MEAVKVLLAAGADANIGAKTELQQLPIHQAVLAKRINADIISIFLREGNDINAKLSNGETPLYISLQYTENSPTEKFLNIKNAPIARFLVENGAAVNSQTTSGWTPLMRAVSKSNDAIIPLLLAEGADTTIVSKEDDTALYLAVRERNAEAVALLLRNNANPNSPERLDKLPLLAALRTRQWNIAKKILPHQSRMLDPRAVFELSIVSDDAEFITSLLQKGYDPKVKKEDGLSPLHFSAMRGTLNIIDLFLANGLDIQDVDNAGHHPLYYAVLNKHEAAARYLINKGSKIAKVTSSGEESSTSASTYALKGRMFHEEALFEDATQSYQIAMGLFDQASVAYDEMRKEFKRKLTNVKVGNFFKGVGVSLLQGMAAAGSQYQAQYQAQQVSKTHAEMSAMKYAVKSNTGISGYSNYMAGHNRYMDKHGSTPYAYSYSQTGYGVGTSATSFSPNDPEEIKQVMLSYEGLSQQAVKDKEKVESVLSCYRENPNNRAKCADDLWGDPVVTDSKASSNTKAGSASEALARMSESLDTADIPRIRELIADGADVNARNKFGVTTLFMASEYGRTEIVNLLLAAKADVGIPRKDGATPLLQAAWKGHIEIARLLVAENAIVDAANKHGMTPLYLASQEGHTESVKMLLKAGADVHATHRTVGSTPLFMAAQYGHTEVVRLLLEAKADVNAAITDGRTPLYMASGRGHAEVVRLLLAAGADVHAKFEKNETNSLFIASQEGYPTILELLLSAGGDFDAQNVNGVTALYVASENGHTEIVIMLLKAGADVHTTHKTVVSTPLFMAAQNGHADIVKYLLEKGAEVNVQIDDGRTPLFRASQKGYAEVVKLLVGAGADKNLTANVAGQPYTPLGIAEKNGHGEVVKVLAEAKSIER